MGPCPTAGPLSGKLQLHRSDPQSAPPRPNGSLLQSHASQGETAGCPLPELMTLLGKPEVLERLQPWLPPS
jgi:hypothetical protein